MFYNQLKQKPARLRYKVAIKKLHLSSWNLQCYQSQCRNMTKQQSLESRKNVDACCNSTILTAHLTSLQFQGPLGNPTTKCSSDPLND